MTVKFVAVLTAVLVSSAIPAYAQSVLGSPSAPLSVDARIAAASRGDVQAQYDLGLCFRRGLCGPVDYNKALIWLQKAADVGLSDAQLEVGRMYTGGYGLAVDKVVAMQWLQKSAAQKNGKAEYCLWQLYKSAAGINGNAAKALIWADRAKADLPTAANANDPEAQMDLYLLAQQSAYRGNESGEKERVPVDKEMAKYLPAAVKTYKSRAASGDVEALWALATPGLGHMPSLDADMRVAADRGVILAQFFVALIADIREDHVTAVTYYKLAATGNFTDAQLGLGTAYFMGQGVDKNISAALDLFTRAAQSGSIKAENLLGDIYSGRFNDHEVPVDGNTAVQWYEKAAYQGDTQAMLRLAVLYSDGALVKADPEQARMWLIKINDLVAADPNSALRMLNDHNDMERVADLAPLSPDDEAKAQNWATLVQFNFP